MKNNRVMVFGVFDGLHKGHLYFLREARKRGELIAVVARDSAVKKLKNKIPKCNEKERLRAVREVAFVRKAVLGDKNQGAYAVVGRYKPDIICFGYDQKWLEKDLKARMKQGLIPPISLARLKPYHADKFKSSKLNLHYSQILKNLRIGERALRR